MDNKFIVEALENIADKVRAFPNNCRLFGEWPRFDFILLLSNAANRLKKQEATLNCLRSTMEDMVRGNASEEVSYLLRLIGKWE